jgi:hypothetical protein
MSLSRLSKIKYKVLGIYYKIYKLIYFTIYTKVFTSRYNQYGLTTFKIRGGRGYCPICDNRVVYYSTVDRYGCPTCDIFTEPSCKCTEKDDCPFIGFKHINKPSDLLKISVYKKE